MTTKLDSISTSALESYLSQHDEEAWARTLSALIRSIHEVDKNATQIWFAFYPISLFQAFEGADDQEELARQLLMKGRYFLKDQIDSSHKFLYGHRYWPQVKSAIESLAGSFAQPATAAGEQLSDLILRMAGEVSKAAGVDTSLLVGITAAGLMTLRQSGLTAFKSAKGEMLLDRKHAKQTPEQILRDRAKDDGQGLFGFLKTVDRKWTVTYDETDENGFYTMKHDQDIAWGASDDRTRNWREIDSRRPEGPIPVECRSASCGTCWVGVLGGAEKLSDVAVREGKQIKEFGYLDTTDPKPLIRLACQASIYGAVSVVIPPWNAVFGKFLKANNQVKHQSSEQID